MKAFAGSFALALVLSCVSVRAPSLAVPAPPPALQDADQTPEGADQPDKGSIREVYLERHARFIGTTCHPTHVNFRGRIVTDGPTFVTYRWQRSDGTYKNGVLQFTKADKRPIGTDWAQTSTFSGWVQLIVLTPKRVETQKTYFRVNCGTG